MAVASAILVSGQVTAADDEALVLDLAVIGQDPRFGGGCLAMTEAFVAGSIALGRKPTFFHLAHPTLRRRPLETSIVRTRPLRSFGNIDALNQVLSARAATEVGGARSVWVAATHAACGLAALRSRRAYGCWIATALEDEWASRQPGLPASRRWALRVNAPVLSRAERAVLRGASLVAVISPATRASLAHRAGLDEESIRVIPIPVDTDGFGARIRQTRNDEPPVIVFVGRASDPRKNVPALVDAFARLRHSHPGARLRLVGEAPTFALPDGVEATGFVTSVAEELAQATVFALPSLQEGFGLVVAEALATGVPVVSTPCGGPEHLLDASGGGIVAGGFSADDLYASLAELLDDNGRLAAMGRAGRAYVEREHAPSVFRTRLADAFAAVDEH